MSSGGRRGRPRRAPRGRPTEGEGGGRGAAPLAEEDVIDGFLILSFVNYQDMESDTKGSGGETNGLMYDVEVEEEEEEAKDDSDKEDGDNNNEPATPNQNIVAASPKPEPPPPPTVNGTHQPNDVEKVVDNGNFCNKNCDTADETKKVPPDLEVPRPESPKHDAAVGSSFPLKSQPLVQNGPSAAVAAVTAPTSAAATVSASSTSPAGAFPFPDDYIHHQPPKAHNFDAAYAYYDKKPFKSSSELLNNCDAKKIPNRTTYYQSIVNKSHSRHNKSSRKVLPASAYDTKQVVNNSYPQQPKQQELPSSNCLPVKPSTYSHHHHYSGTETTTKKQEYPVSSAVVSNNNHAYAAYKTTEVQQHHHNNSYPHESSSRSSGSSYKTNPELCGTGYNNTTTRDNKPQPVAVNNLNNSVSNSNKPYSQYHHQQSRNYHHHHDVPHQKVDNTPVYNNNSSSSDYYQKGNNLTYSKSSNNNNGISNTSSDTYKSSSSSSDQHSSYQHQSKSYHHHHSPRTGEKTTRNYYPANHHQEGSYKSYRQDLVPKQQTADDYRYHQPSYYDNNSLKSKEVVDPPTKAPNPSESGSVSDNAPLYPVKDKTPYYPYPDPSYYHHPHRRTPPPNKPPAFEPKEGESSFRLSSSLSAPTQARQVVSSPVSQVAKTLWSPTAATTNLLTSAASTNREIITASSRDSHSSHSNSSISSLSQLSQSLGSTPQGQATQSKEYPREGRSSSRSSNETPACSTSSTLVTTPTTTSSSSSSSSSFGVSGSLTSLIFSKPAWTSSSNSSQRSASPVPSVLPLAPSLPHSPFGHHVMFAPPLPPPASSLSSPFAAESSLFAPPPPSQDLLNIRRELDTRFLASQDRSLNVPPPPYLRAEMHQHQHQHTHMHQHSPFLPPPLGGSLLPPAAHLYDKFPKMDTSFYGRNALGLPTYPSLSPLLAPGSASATPTPFAPPGHLAAFQPKISPLVKAKPVKSGRWCAMHVRISWEIYHHQQKQQAESQKGAASKSDLLRPPNHLFSSMPRPHELGFSSPLLGAAASLHAARSPYEVSSQHPGFLGPSPAHLGITPFARPNYPSMGVPGNSFGGLGSLAGLTSAGMLSGRGDLGPGGYLSMSQDPWGRLHRTPPNFSALPPAGGSSWGGLKAEAEREKDKQQKRAEAEKREKEAYDKSKEMARERESKKEHEKQKERDRENRERHPPPQPPQEARNGGGEPSSWERSRSPLRNPPASTHNKPPEDVKVKEEEEEGGKGDYRLPPPPPHFWSPLPRDDALLHKYAAAMMPPPLRPTDPPFAPLFPFGYAPPPRPKPGGSPGGNGLPPPPLVPCQSPSALKLDYAKDSSRHSGEAESQSR